MAATISNDAGELLTPQTPYDFLVQSSLIVRQFDMVEAATALRSEGGGEGEADDTADELVPERSRKASGRYSMMLLFFGKDLFTPEALRTMCEVENVLLGDEHYALTCLNSSDATYRTRGRGGECGVPSMSAVALFYADWALRAGADAFPAAAAPADAPSSASFLRNDSHKRTCIPLGAAYVAARAQEIYALAAASPSKRAEFGFFLSRDTLETAPPRTRATRSLLYMGSPLGGKSSSQAKTKLEASLEAMESALFDYCNMTAGFLRSAYRDSCVVSQLQLKFYAGALESKQFSQMTGEDTTMVLASVVFVTFYIGFHSGSLVMALLGIAQIVLSLPIALFFYSALLRIAWFSQMHILAFFVVLGIGADDIFVFLDAWRQSKALPAHISATLESRLAHAYRRTAFAVFNTSFTTAIAFFATGLSTIMPIAAFGIYAALCIIVNFALVVTWWPTAIIVWEVYLKQPVWELAFAAAFVILGACGFLVAMLSLATMPLLLLLGLCVISLALVVFGARAALTQRRVLRARAQRTRGGGGAEPSEPSAALDVAAAARFGHVEHFFHAHHATALNWAPWPRHAAPPRRSSATDGQGSGARHWQKPTLKPFSLGCAAALLALGLYLSYEALRMEPPNEQEVWFPRDHMLTGLGDEVREAFMVGSDEAYVRGSVWFGLKGFDRAGFNRYKPAENRGELILDEQFELHTADAQHALLGFCGALRNASCAVDGCSRPPYTLVVPEAVVCWLEAMRDSYNHSLPTGEAFAPAVGAWLRSADGAAHSRAVGLIDGELAFTSVSFQSTLRDDLPGKVVRGYYREWKAFLDGFVATAPPALRTAFVSTGGTFVWMVTEAELVQGIYTGFAICFPVAFLVLCVATSSLRISSFAVVSIAMIVGCLLGFVHVALDWSLGVGESIAGTIVIGLAVDYTVHLGHAYTESDSWSREAKTTDALTQMGVTVVAGGITTLGSSVFMYACQVTFFTKMATLIGGTIAFSLLFSLLFFMPLCALAGPSGRIVKMHERAQLLRRRCCAMALRRRKPSRPGGARAAAAAPLQRPTSSASGSCSTSVELQVEHAVAPAASAA
mmetsp:Transcript_59645/g.136805  ORF Transcript_59645/g.136805 Transcript_59645/m.136805 type:complete len:1076 (-) Transcript_59645:308-3535(-)